MVTLAGCSVFSSADPVPCGSAEPERTAHRYLEIDDVDPNLTSLDVYATPGAEGCPVIVWVHGGSWQAGDKRTRSTITKAEHFIDDGYVFVSINYRLAAGDNDVRWPAFGDDVASAVAWVDNNRELIGADTGPITLIGHSSGAHLVSIVGTNPSLLTRSGGNPDQVGCVVSLDSVTHDLTDPPPWEVDIITTAFPTEADLIDGSPSLQAEAGEWPDGPSFLIVTRGRPERIESSERLAAALGALGRVGDVADVSPYDHGEASTQLGVDGEEPLTPIVDEFIAGCTSP